MSQDDWAQRLAPVLLNAEVATTLTVSGQTQAAVLVALYRNVDGQLCGVFTKRRADLRNHAGQISFPGGRRDPGDSDLLRTALREAEEEVGLKPALVNVLGALQPTPTIATDFAVFPFVGVIPGSQPWAAAPSEVAAVFELSLDELRAGYERRVLTRRGVSFRTDCYIVGPHLIWGATARMLGDLFDRMAAVGL